jgi:hypothetical protein
LDVVVGDAVGWGEAQGTDDGVLERLFQLARPGRVVPGVVWLPSRPECDGSPGPFVPIPRLSLGRLGQWQAESAGINVLPGPPREKRDPA